MRANGPAYLPPYCRFLFPARAIVNGTKSYTVSDADIQSPNAAVSALKSGGGEGVNKMRANGPACLPPYCRFLFPAPQSSTGPRATPSATRTFSRPGYRLAIDGPSGPDLRVIYGTAALAPLRRATAHALALFRTPGNFRLKRRGVGFEKRGIVEVLLRGCHDLLRSKKRGDGETFHLSRRMGAPRIRAYHGRR